MVLVVEDCIDTFLLVEKALHGFEAKGVQTLKEAKRALKTHKPDLIIIDIELPDGNGVDFCLDLNTDSSFQNVPKIILTARDQVSDKVHGLYSGANDYITKPFAMLELRARCEVQMRTIKTARKALQIIGDFEFDLNFQSLRIAKNKEELLLDLTPTEFRILYLLVSHANEVFSRQELVKKIWTNNGTNIEKRGLDTHVSHLRKKLGSYGKPIKSVYGKGYCFKL